MGFLWAFWSCFFNWVKRGPEEWRNATYHTHFCTHLVFSFFSNLLIYCGHWAMHGLFQIKPSSWILTTPCFEIMGSYINSKSRFPYLQNGLILSKLKIALKINLSHVKVHAYHRMYSKHSTNVLSSSRGRHRSPSDLAVFLSGRSLSLGIYTEGTPWERRIIEKMAWL